MIFLSKSSLRYASEVCQLAVGAGTVSRIPSTLGSMRSWQYDSAVSEIACSSSVNKLLVFKGSCQSNFTGACRYRLPRAADRSGVRNCLVACLYVGRNMLKSCSRTKKVFQLHKSYCYTRHKTKISVIGRRWPRKTPRQKNRGSEALRGGKEASIITSSTRRLGRLGRLMRSRETECKIRDASTENAC